MVAIPSRRGLSPQKHTRLWPCTSRTQAAAPAAAPEEGDAAALAPFRSMKCWQTGWLEANTVPEEAQ